MQQADPQGTSSEQREIPIAEPADDPAHVRLLRAASSGNVATVRALLVMGVDPDMAASEADVQGMTSPPLELGATALMLARGIVTWKPSGSCSKRVPARTSLRQLV